MNPIIVKWIDSSVRRKVLIFLLANSWLMLLSLTAIAFAREVVLLPIEFSSNFEDDPRLKVDSTEFSAGIPAFNSRGVAFYRFGKVIVKRDPQSKRELLPFVDEAANAIDRDLFGSGGHWDRAWDYGQMIDDRIVIDDHDRAYTILTPRKSNLQRAVLLYSLDGCRTWHAIGLKGRTAAVEHWDGFNSHEGPPTVLSNEYYGGAEKADLWLERFHFNRQGILKPDFPPALVSDDSLLGSNHSGGSNSTFTTSHSVFIVYPGRRLPAGGRGTSIWIRQYDLRSNAFTAQSLNLGVAGDISPLRNIPSPDAHNIPAITSDSAGTLFVIFGAHHGMFKLTMSLKPEQIASGWSTPEPFGEHQHGSLWGSYSYASVAMDLDQTLHVFARSEGDRYRFQLVQMTKPQNMPFIRWPNTLMHRVVVDPGRAFYAAWRQKVALDRSGRLYLHFKYWPNQFTNEEAQSLHLDASGKTECRAGRCFFFKSAFLFPTTLVSANGGKTFELYDHGVADELSVSER